MGEINPGNLTMVDTVKLMMSKKINAHMTRNI